MERELAAVAEALAYEFGDLDSGGVVRVVTDCADELPDHCQHLVEQAARGRLQLLRRSGAGAGTCPPARDSLDVSLHDDDLSHEVELLSHLMVAANESDRPLTQGEVDRLLGVPTRSSGPTFPFQRNSRLGFGVPRPREA
jgi:hypothetical protein